MLLHGKFFCYGTAGEEEWRTKERQDRAANPMNSIARSVRDRDDRRAKRKGSMFVTPVSSRKRGATNRGKRATKVEIEV